jgi:hypothetical protein
MLRVNVTAPVTQVAYDGPTPIPTKMVLLANDTNVPSTGAAYPAALGGWAGGGKAGVPNGVFGYTSVNGGRGVVGADVSTTNAGAGVLGTSSNGSGVMGVSYGSSVRGGHRGYRRHHHEHFAWQQFRGSIRIYLGCGR